MSRSGQLAVEVSRCIRCGACPTLAPDVFDLVDGASRVRREPTADERSLVEAARFICPTDAIRGGSSDEERSPGGASTVPVTYAALAGTAERARWSLEAVPWSLLQPERATPELRAVVREMAISESATYSATQRFLEAFFDDLEVSKWIAVWFYEETRHPHVLLEWLRRVGEPLRPEAEVQGRVSTPLMRSAFGTLATNVISEVTAAHAYRRLAARATEPVLAGLARAIAGDEARHAASFFRFAKERLAAAPAEEARRDRARALEVLSAWLGDAQPTTHPVAQMLARLDQLPSDATVVGIDFLAVRARVVRVIGLLLGIPLRRPEDVGPALREHLIRRGAT